MNLAIKIADNRQDFAACVVLRTIVFLQEQECPYGEEFNAEENEATYYIAYDGDTPVATARYRNIDGYFKIERVCVAKEYRGTGAGKKIMQFIINDIETKHPKAIFKLCAQDHAIKFYEGLGFTAYGDGFIEANIPHHMMERGA